LACEQAGITVTLPKPMTSNSKAEGRFGKQDFRYVAEEDAYICPAGERLAYCYTNEENGLVAPVLDHACQNCAIKHNCTTGKERRITRCEHEHILEAVPHRLDEHPEKMRRRRETVEHPFGTIKARMGATHFLMKTLPRVAAEMALHVLAYNLTRVMNIIGIQPLLVAMRHSHRNYVPCCRAVRNGRDPHQEHFQTEKPPNSANMLLRRNREAPMLMQAHFHTTKDPSQTFDSGSQRNRSNASKRAGDYRADRLLIGVWRTSTISAAAACRSAR
jgi:Transposase DDE domain